MIVEVLFCHIEYQALKADDEFQKLWVYYHEVQNCKFYFQLKYIFF